MIKILTIDKNAVFYAVRFDLLADNPHEEIDEEEYVSPGISYLRNEQLHREDGPAYIGNYAVVFAYLGYEILNTERDHNLKQDLFEYYYIREMQLWHIDVNRRKCNDVTKLMSDNEEFLSLINHLNQIVELEKLMNELKKSLHERSDRFLQSLDIYKQ